MSEVKEKVDIYARKKLDTELHDFKIILHEGGSDFRNRVIMDGKELKGVQSVRVSTTVEGTTSILLEIIGKAECEVELPPGCVVVVKKPEAQLE